MGPRNVARENDHPVACGSHARDYNQSLENNIDGHGVHSCVVGALDGSPARQTVVVATAGGSHRRSHGERAIRHLPR